MADEQHVEVAGTATSTAAAPLAGGGVRRRCRRGRGRGRLRQTLGADQNNPVVLGVERGGFAARFGLHGLFHRKARGAAFLDDGQRAVALRAERLHCAGIESAAVRAVADGQRGQHFSVVSIDHDADIGVRAHGEQNVILHIQTEAARFAGAVAEVILGDDLERFDIHDGDFLLVLDIHIQFSPPVALGLLHRAADIHSADDRAVLGINHRDAGRLMAEHINAIRQRLQQDAVGPALNVNALDLLHRLRIEHAERAAAAKTVMRCGVNGHAVTADVGDGADVFVAVQVEYKCRAAARHINAPGVVVGIDIINAAVAHELGGVENLVRGAGLGENIAGQQADSRHGQDA